MSKHILMSGDEAHFAPTFGPATVTVAPGEITGTGRAEINGKPVCLEGDEASVVVANCAYLTSAGHVGGLGTLQIQSLAPDQVAKETDAEGKCLLLVGSTFQASFTVTTPASIPGSPPTPDPTSEYSGSGHFVSQNQFVTVD